MNASSSEFSRRWKVAVETFVPVAGCRTCWLLLLVTLQLILAHRLPAPIFEVPEKPPSAPGTSLNADGSRTVYEVDNASHTALATVTEPSGKVREKIRYELDTAGHCTDRKIFDPDGRLRSKSLYKYDKAGRVVEETQLGKSDVVLHKIAYSYDPQTGKQTGHSVLFDRNGKSLDQTTAALPSRSPAKAPFGESAPGG